MNPEGEETFHGWRPEGLQADFPFITQARVGSPESKRRSEHFKSLDFARSKIIAPALHEKPILLVDTEEVQNFFPDLKNQVPFDGTWIAYRKASILLRCVLVCGANPNFAKEGENSPLHKAIIAQRMPLVKVLLDHKAWPNHKGEKDITPLMLAAHQGNVGLVQQLRELNGNPSLKDAESRAAFYNTRLLSKALEIEIEGRSIPFTPLQRRGGGASGGIRVSDVRLECPVLP